MLRDMSNAEYHASSALNQSTAKELVDTTPQHVRHKLDNPPEEPPTPFLVGGMTHTAALQPHLLDEEYGCLPDEIDGHGSRTKYYKEALADLRLSAPGKRWLKRSDYDLSLSMASALLEHPILARHLSDSEALVEQSGFCEWEGCECRVRPDLLCPDDGVVIDLKTTSSPASERSFTRSVRNFGYAFQNCWYREMLRTLGHPVGKFIFLVVEKSGNHATAAYTLSGSDVDAQLGRMRDACNLWSYCSEVNAWPGYPQDVVNVDLAPHAADARRLSLREIDARFGCSPYIAKKLIRSHELEVRRIGNRRTVDAGDFAAALRMRNAGKSKNNNNNTTTVTTVTTGATTEAGKGDDENHGSS